MSPSNTELRGSGRTSRQLRAAPPNAIFVWCDSRMHYVAALARFLGRDDIEIVSCDWLDGASWRADRRPIVFDHRIKQDQRLTYDQWEAIHQIEQRQA